MTRPLALVTGASSGIGREFARELAERGFDLVVVARREERLRALKEELEGAHGVSVRVEAADLEDPQGTAALCDRLDRDGLRVHTVVANAGYGLPGRYLAHDWDTHERFLRLLLTSPCELVHRLLPGMLEAGAGRVVLVASLAGLLPSSAGHTLYGGVKSALIHFAQALAPELAGSGVRVSAVCPGFTTTEFHDVTGTREQVARMPRVMWLDARRVAREGLDRCDAGRVVWVPGRLYRLMLALVTLIPQGLRHALANRGAGAVRDQSGGPAGG